MCSQKQVEIQYTVYIQTYDAHIIPIYHQMREFIQGNSEVMFQH